MSEFVIYLATGEIKTVRARDLRTAVRTIETDPKAQIVAAVARECLPTPSGTDQPFLAVLLANPNFVAPAES